MVSAYDYARMCANVYEDAPPSFSIWHPWKPRNTCGGGFQAITYKSGANKNWVVAFRGTWDCQDLKTDLKLGVANRGLGRPSLWPVDKAVAYYREVRDAARQCGDEKVGLSITGHSLGGALATIVAMREGKARAVAFNPPGVMELLQYDGPGWMEKLGSEWEVINFNVGCDLVHRESYQPGKTITLPSRVHGLNLPLEWHRIKNIVETIFLSPQADDDPSEWVGDD